MPAMSAEDVIKPWPRSPDRLASAVIDTLMGRIVSGDFPPGSVLPTEPTLGETFGSSRTVAREAIETLEKIRHVRAQQSQGTRTSLPQR